MVCYFCTTTREECHQRTRSTTIRHEARICAERMGYHWLANTDPSLPFDGLMYRTAAVVAVILKKVRYALSDTCFIEKKSWMMLMPFEPFPSRIVCFVSSGSGRRTSGHGDGSISCRKQLRKLSSILRKTTATPTSVEKDWENAPCRLDILCCF